MKSKLKFENLLLFDTFQFYFDQRSKDNNIFKSLKNLKDYIKISFFFLLFSCFLDHFGTKYNFILFYSFNFKINEINKLEKLITIIYQN